MIKLFLPPAIYLKLKSSPMAAIFTPNYLNWKSKENHHLLMNNVLLDNGVAKTTQPGRFTDIDSWLSQNFYKSYVSIHDIAVSSGITSLELKQNLERDGFKVNLSISDKFMSLSYFKRNLITYFYDNDGNYVLGNIFGIVAQRNCNNFFFISRFLSKITSRNAKKRFDNCLPELLLLHPEVCTSIDQKEVTFINYDIFKTSIYNEFDVVRAMNILNPIYFDVNEIKTAVRLMFDSLKDGGILIIGRTHLEDQKNHVSIYVKKDDILITSTIIKHYIISFLY
jgi:hypothetical protein